MKTQFKNYISLTKKEWNGMVVLLVLIAAVLAAPYIYQFYHKDNTINVTEFNADFAALNHANPRLLNGPESPKTDLFKFDPNTVSTNDWQRLGITAKQAAIIKNYTTKGGRFRKVGDLQKIYGLTKVDYARLAPFIIIPEEKTKPNVVVEVNSADSAKLTTIDGIGGAFAKRIIYYRERLGGFTSKEQLKEVFGIDDLKYDEIKGQVKVDADRIRKININTVTFDKLRPMPYLNYKQVNAIIEYRNQHGNYASIHNLENIAIIDADILRKIGPYLIYK
ncbi:MULTISPECIES: helix-hairpin-helix domain-containing protein [unclassified Mucilaginibacter]|uniref:ComEA family DNA-binding protein n=1 Tax=unclassified Mucilaginibacter TaxID=2617802 RepID=UPI002AC946C2|nr:MULTISPECIES: helix-hairpin-helix domain-containing protein [unclassified Mucilaginibacter]MEB0262417.1 helix-hairpin-helix domain-containing protein [Mucilaginibacter sp. 10I4]MEB0277926.1 helix-hairpin-helix domain-containing protein [Mucilaginibacter sp. 10B2]MEB0299721.1 helix-hairpin-helix domain-containing protein [Mucilaginibacter sp. 5C4]WPX22817.1 helix-hairpin-helix domain-containing protein [Mucilaginibacter sp. 5C4]